MVYNKTFAKHVLREHVEKTYARFNFRESWRNLPEIPTSEEILQDVSWQDIEGPERPLDYQKLAEPKEFDPRLPHNNIDRPWDSKEEYLGFHYRILREDAVAPLRQSVAEFKRNSDMGDGQDTAIYTDIHLVGLKLSHFGVAFRIEFSTDRAGKRIRWEQSKRLTAGGLVCLSPSSDKFRTICKVGIVAARPLEGGLDQDPPQVDIFFGDDDDIILNPAESYVMVESRLGFFEAYRHVLVALQKLTTEESPYIEKYLIEMDKNVLPPDYIKLRPCLDLRSIALSSDEHLAGLTNEEEEELCHFDILKGFPVLPKSGMDDSQLAACKRMLTQSLAIVQGPPGTGKTFTSVQTLKVMLSNRGGGPIIVAAQTNHALDQLLTHIAGFEENFVRLGNRCDKGNPTIVERTLYALREENKKDARSSGTRVAARAHDALIEEIQQLLLPITHKDLLSGEVLLESNIMSREHYESFFELGWSSSEVAKDENREPLEFWLGEQIVRMPRTPGINKNLEIEDPDQEFEQVQELEAEVSSKDDMESLRGEWVPLRRKYTGKGTGRRYTGKNDPRNILAKNESLYDIPEKYRGAVYCYWEKLYYDQLTRKLIERLAFYQRSMKDLKMAKWERDVKFIDYLGTKIIGCTTTGLSKYRGLLSALNPSTLLIEEAAETLEANVTAGIIPSLQQVILVGDHRQLTANTTLDRFMSHPYHMSISLFERLVNNGMGYTMLNKQRRMIPEVRELLCIDPNPFYVDLHDHPSVLDRINHRPRIPGMNVDSFFFSHKWQERRDINMSCYNAPEAEMVAGFFNYLVINGIKPANITVLTYYNGQRKLLLKELSRRVTSIATPYFKVYTVDSYQGEENEVILLSLVRGNPDSSVGFLRSKNRVVVALSRAQRGLYVFGNALTIAGQEGDNGSRENLWLPILLHLLDEKRYGSNLPIVCSKHQITTNISEPEHWEELSGGCDKDCGGMLPCGHLCPHKCHPTPHDQILCKEPCEKILPCDHGCSTNCGDICRCDECRVSSRLQDLELESTSEEAFSDDRKGKGPSQDTPPNQRQRSPQKFFSEPSSRPMTANQQIARNIFYTPFISDISNQSSGSGTPYTFAPSPTKRGLLPEEGRQAWSTWDPVHSDKVINQERLERERLENENKPNPEDLVFEETHKPVRFENGKRIVGPKVQKVIPRLLSSNEVSSDEKVMTDKSNGVSSHNSRIRRCGNELTGSNEISNGNNENVQSINGVNGSNNDYISNHDEITPSEGLQTEILQLSNDDFDFLESL